MADRDEYVYRAKLAEQAERYDEMCEYMQRIAAMGSELTVEERNLLSVAFKNVITSKRNSWRILAREEEKLKDKPEEIRYKCTIDYKAKIEKEIQGFCEDILPNCIKNLINHSASPEALVFYRKMEGDYYRYKAEVSVGNTRKEAAEAALIAYKAAVEQGNSDLERTNPIYLGLMLNYAVFLYEILDNPKKACNTARTAFDNAIAELDTMQDAYKDSTTIMQLLRDNLTLWTSELSQGNNDVDAEDVQQVAT